MADIVASLKEIIEKYPAVLNDDKKLKSILKDYFPEDKRTQNHLYMVADEGILEDMQDTTEIKKFKMLGYIHSLAADYGIPETMAKDAIMIWVDALEITAENVKVEDTTASASKAQRQGNVIDYSNTLSDDIDSKGTVLKFSGKGQKIISGVKLENTTYLVKTTGRPFLNFYDYRRNKQLIVVPMQSPSENIYQTGSWIDIKQEGIIEVTATLENWTVEMRPI